jgi:hypothetical protein
MVRSSLVLAAFAATLCMSACEKPAETAAATDPAAAVSGPAEAAAPAPAAEIDLKDMEGPAPGKWKLVTSMSGTAMPPIEVCYEKMTIADMQDAQKQSGVTCSEQRYFRQGADIMMHAKCSSSGNMTTTMDTRMTGDLKTAYQMEMKMVMEPAPAPGMGEQTMKVEATRLGDCDPK